jgi:ATP-binding cassette subfamily B protein
LNSARTLRAKLVHLREALKHLPAALGMVWKAAPGWTVAWLVVLVGQGVLPVATVYLTRILVDALVAGVKGRAGTSWHAVVGPGIAFAIVLLLGEVLPTIASWVSLGQSECVQDHIQARIHRQSVEVDLGFYETPEFYDHLHRARMEASYRPVAVLGSLGSLFQNALTLVAMAWVLLPFGIWLPAALFVATLPAVLIVLHQTVRLHEWRRRATTRERRSWYYDWLLTGPESAAELRLFDLGKIFQAAFSGIRAELRRERLDLARTQSLAQIGAAALGMGVAGATLLWMAGSALQGRFSLGQVAMLYQAFYQGLRLMRALLDSAGQLYANILFLGNLFEFLALRPGIVDPAEPAHMPAALEGGIRFQDVVFRYPGSRQPALRGLSLAIDAGRFVAIVGSNGAGKSTLARLLCRFYDPDSGTIEIDGIDIRRFRAADLRRQMTALFQQPVHYSATAGQNIAVSRASDPPDIARIRQAATLANVDRLVDTLPAGYETLLGKWFPEGTDLSVGEWQRLALARAYARCTPVVILDEPTSAMDPWTERQWVERFREATRGRTAIVITHRLTTAMHADVIHVMADGRVVESGTHEELLASAGLYYQAWDLRRDGGPRGWPR